MNIFQSSNSYFSAIGRMAVYVSYVEDRVDAFYDYCFQNKRTYKPKKPTTDKLIQIQNFHKNNLSLINLCDATMDLFEDRNRIIHGRIWGNRSKHLPKITHLRSNTKSEYITIKQIDDVHLNSFTIFKNWCRFIKK